MRVRGKRHRFVLISLLAVQLFSMFVGQSPAVQAEAFVATPFQAQWNATDSDVATGKASRTYFWGPAPFAHTSEMYADSPNGGQREVQYFDKARMELTAKTGTDPNTVTNGLLTVELVSGQLQVGDKVFMTRQPAETPVAGDAINNPNTPTYATFKTGKLAFGVTGALPASDRSNQAIVEAVNRAGTVSNLSQPPVALKYSRYFAQTGHNLADVFDRFFQTAPLNESSWLNVMGYPISEPYWAKDQVVVGGKSKDVLIQLFQRRALTYTPSNPANFQVEMGNIGQHYYAWRYHFDTRDELPGHYRVIYPQGKSLYSVDTRNPANKLKLGDAEGDITGLHILNNGRAVVTSAGHVYLVDLNKARAFKNLDVPANLVNIQVTEAKSSEDGQYIAVGLQSLELNKGLIQLYTTTGLPNDNLNVTSSATIFENVTSAYSNFSFAPDNKYLATTLIYGSTTSALYVQTYNLATKENKLITVAASKTFDFTSTDALHWVPGDSNQLLYTFTGQPNTNSPSKLVKIDLTSGSVTSLVEDANQSIFKFSPDGNYFVIAPPLISSSPNGTFSVRAVANPTVNFSTGSYDSSGINGWSADGTYFQTSRHEIGVGGSAKDFFTTISAVNLQAVQKSSDNSNYNSGHDLLLAGPFYTLHRTNVYNGPDKPSDDTVTLQNLDGSDKQVIFDGHNSFRTVGLAQLVQLPNSR